MLKSFPELVLSYAVDGVIAPSALGQAARADQLLAVARCRATEVLAAVPAQVQQAMAQARRDGFQQGYADAIVAGVPVLAAALADAQALHEAVLGKLRGVMAASLAAEGVDATLVLARCEQALAAGDTAMTLYVPTQTPELTATLQTQLLQRESALPLRLASTDADHPLLQVGAMVFELDPVGAMGAAVEASVNSEALETAARARATAYVAAVDARLRPLPFPDTLTGEVS